MKEAFRQVLREIYVAQPEPEEGREPEYRPVRIEKVFAAELLAGNDVLERVEEGVYRPGQNFQAALEQYGLAGPEYPMPSKRPRRR